MKMFNNFRNEIDMIWSFKIESWFCCEAWVGKHHRTCHYSWWKLRDLFSWFQLSMARTSEYCTRYPCQFQKRNMLPHSKSFKGVGLWKWLIKRVVLVQRQHIGAVIFCKKDDSEHMLINIVQCNIVTLQYCLIITLYIWLDFDLLMDYDPAWRVIHFPKSIFFCFNCRSSFWRPQR